MRDENIHEELFVDHAWQEMRKVLDREMPERKRRGFFWLWLLPALIFCTLLCRDTLSKGMPLLKKEELKQGQPFVQKNTPIPANAKPGPKNKIHATDTPVDIAAVIPHPSQPNTLQAKRKQGTPSQVSKPQPGLSPTSARPAPQEERNGTMASSAEQLAANPPGNFENITTTSIDEATVERIAVTAKIAQPSPSLLPARVLELESPSQYPHLPSVKRRSEWWLEAGTQFSLGINGLSGYRTGLVHVIPFGRSKNRLWLGLAYESTETSFLQRVRPDSSNNDVVGTGSSGAKTTESMKVGISLYQDPSAISSPGRQNSGKTISSIQLQLVHFNASFFHSFHRRFGITLGGSVQYLQGIKLDERYLRSPFATREETSFDLGFSNSSGNQTSIGNLSKDNFRTFGFATHAALLYQLSPRWGTQLGFRHTLHHFTKEESLLLRPSWVDLGVRYRLR